MKAIQFHTYGGPEVLALTEVPVPCPGPHQIRIRVCAAGVNPSDWKRRSGLYQDFEPLSFPVGVGVEAAGIVEAIGPEVKGVKIGDAVFGFGQDTQAEQALLTHWAPKPDTLPFIEAAGLPVVVETAVRILSEVGILPGQTLLVCGAAGGIGSAVLQLAHLRGIMVIGTASLAKYDYVRTLGALPIPYGPGLAERVKNLSPLGIDAALDLVGAGNLDELIAITGRPEKVLSIADFSAESLGARFSYGPPKDPETVLSGISALCTQGLFHMHVDQIFPLSQTAHAQTVSAEGRVTGKLVIVPDLKTPES